MKKFLIVLAIIVAGAIGVSVYYVGQLDGMIAEIIEEEGSAAIGAKVSVDSVETKLQSGVATINGLSIANAPGFASVNAIRIGSVASEVDYQEQIVKRVSIVDTQINADLIGKDSNFQKLLDNMPESEPVSAPDTQTDTEQEQEQEQKFAINLLEMRNATINVNSDKLGETSFVMDDFVLTDLNGTVDELSDTITDSLISHVTEQVKAYAQSKIVSMAKEEAVKRVKELAAEKLTEQGAEKLSGKLGDKVKVKGLKFKLKKD